MSAPRTSLGTTASVALAIAAATAGVLPVFLTGALGVQLRHSLHLGSADIGIGVAAFFASSALCSVTAGRLAERLGALTMMRSAATVALFSMFGLAICAHAFWTLTVLLVVGGISNGAMQPAVNLYLSANVRSRRQGLAFGVKQAAIPTATMLSGLAVPALAITEGWQSAFLAAGGVVAGVTLLLFVRRDGTAAPNPADPQSSAPAPVPVSPFPPQGAGPLRGGAIRLGPLVLLAAGMAGAVAASNALGAFVVPSAVHSGLAAGSAGVLSAMGSVAGFATRVGQGWRADSGVTEGIPAAIRHLAVVVAMVGLGILGYLALASGISALLIPGVLLAYGAGWGFNGLFNLAVVRAYPHAPARATGVTQVGTYVGGMLGPLGFGLLAEHAGFGASWYMCAGAAAVGAVTLVAARRLLARGVLHPVDATAPEPAVLGCAKQETS